MKRRPLLHVINFLLPILFFLTLDVASFFISDHRGEKLGFKVTVLLAISVLLLILNDILPSMSNKTPLIGKEAQLVTAHIMTHCVVNYLLLETIFVMYLMEKDSASQDNETNEDRSTSEDCNQQGKANFLKCHGGETRSQLHELLVSGELREMEKTLTLLLDSRKEEVKPGYWTRVAKRVNVVFFIFYVTVVTGFLIFIFLKWNNA
uniref:Neurotransmitter-gated ion-channel transmembrane domain-containing protein n=1 Tax=Lates calcarifer TaxID=8187 RepID=A0A4W6DEZ1_LATCA